MSSVGVQQFHDWMRGRRFGDRGLREQMEVTGRCLDGLDVELEIQKRKCREADGVVAFVRVQWESSLARTRLLEQVLHSLSNHGGAGECWCEQGRHVEDLGHHPRCDDVRRALGLQPNPPCRTAHPFRDVSSRSA